MVREAQGGLHLLLGRAVALLHAAIVIFFAFGWLLPWEAISWTVLLGGIVMQGAWRAFNDDCPLTVLERRLNRTNGNTDQNPTDGQRFFVSRLLARIIGRPVSDRTGNWIVYLVLYSSMLICAGKLLS